MTSFTSELFCYIVTVTYNLRSGYAFSTYGDVGALDPCPPAPWCLSGGHALLPTAALPCREGHSPPTTLPCPPCPSLACPAAAICALQNVVIMGLMFRLGSERRSTWLVIATALLAVSWWMLSGACPQAVLAGLQGGAVLLMALGGRMPQVCVGVGVWDCRGGLETVGGA